MDVYMTTTFLEMRPGTCVEIVGSSKKLDQLATEIPILYLQKIIKRWLP